MPKIIIAKSLFKEIHKKFGTHESSIIIDLLETVGDNPRKGKLLGQIAGIAIKEIKYKKYRFYFITDGHQLKFGSVDELASLIIKFVKMSEKKDQQKAIDDIKNVLRSMGFLGFD